MGKQGQRQVRLRKSIKDVLTDYLLFPADVCKNEIKLTVIGNEWAWIENFRGILEFTDEKMTIQGKKQLLMIEGKRLHVNYFTKDEMLVRGKFDAIRYSVKDGKAE